MTNDGIDRSKVHRRDWSKVWKNSRGSLYRGDICDHCLDLGVLMPYHHMDNCFELHPEKAPPGHTFFKDRE